MDPVFTPLTTATLLLNQEVSFGSVESLEDMWDVYCTSGNFGAAGRAEARLYLIGSSGTPTLVATAGIGKIPPRLILGILPVAARATFTFFPNVLGSPALLPPDARSGGVSWELRIVALNDDAAVPVSAILAGYSFSEPFGPVSFDANLAVPVGENVAAIVNGPASAIDVTVDFSTVKGNVRWEVFCGAGTQTLTGQLVAVLATIDTPRGFANKKVPLVQALPGAGAFAYATIINAEEAFPTTIVMNGYNQVGPTGTGSCCGTQEAVDQNAWFFDPQNSTGLASNANDGLTALTPLLGWSEYQHRVGPRPLYYHDVTFTFLSDVNPNDIPRTSFDMAAPFTATLIQTPTLGPTATLDAAAAPNLGANTFESVTDAAVPLWNSGDHYVLTSGPNANTGYFTIAADLGAGLARTDVPYDFTTFNTFTPAGNETYRQATYGTTPSIVFVHTGNVTVRLWRFTQSFVIGSPVYFQLCDFPNGLVLQTDSDQFDGCTIHNFAFGPRLVSFAGMYLNCVQGGIRQQTQFLTLWQGCTNVSGAGFEPNHALFAGTLGLPAFDCTDTVKIRNGSVWAIEGALWGSGNLGFAVDVSGGQLFYIAAGFVFGIVAAGGDFIVNGKTQLFPYDPATGLPAAAIATTFPNLQAAFPAGFGGSAWDSVSPSSGIFAEAA